MKQIRKTPFILLAGVFLSIFSHFLFKTALFNVEPVNAWNEKTLMVIRAKKEANFWPGVNEILTTIDPELPSAISRIKNKTGYSPLELAQKFFPEPFELIISQNNNRDDDESGIRYDFILITKASGKGVENLEASHSAAKDFVSWYIPTKRYTTLNDGAKIKSQIADPLKISLRKEIFMGVEIEYISEPGLPFEYAYAQNNGWLFLATSKGAVEQLISRDDQTLAFNVLGRNCASFGNAASVFFNPKIFKIESKPNLLIISSPIKNILTAMTANKMQISSRGLSLSWDRCAF